MKRFACLIFVFVLPFVSCCYNPCNDVGENWIPPKVHSVYFSPKTAKAGDIIMMVIEKDSWNCTRNLDYNKDFEITDDGKIKYIGTHSDINSNFTTEESRMMGCITWICPEKSDYPAYIEVTEYVSIRGLIESEKEDRDIVLVEFKVPNNAKSGYILTRDPMGFTVGGYSGEKLIIVDENGKEITE